MKKVALLLCTALVCLVASAQYVGPGFYRVHNVKTDCYICIKGTHYERSTQPDAFWPCALMQQDSAQVNDPGSIIYIPDTIQVGLYAQGVDTYTLTTLLLDVHPAPTMDNGLPTYVAYTQYYPDPVNNPDKPFPCYFRDYGYGLTAGSNTRRTETHWWIEPVNEGSMDSSYFAVKPANELMKDAEGYYWTSLCCDFPFLIPEEGGVEGAYTVREVVTGEDGLAQAVAVKVYGCGETVPAATPVLLRCKSAYMSGNKLVPVTGIANHRQMPIASDLLLGNYFSIFRNHASSTDMTVMADYLPEQATAAKDVYLALGVDEEGRLVFTPQEEGTYMAANSAWLNIADVDLEPGTTVYLILAAEEEEIIPGDCDGNGMIDIDDVTILIDYVLGRWHPDDAKSAPARFDVNEDTFVDIDDITAIIQIVLGVD